MQEKAQLGQQMQQRHACSYTTIQQHGSRQEHNSDSITAAIPISIS